jgi:hypothetical protein
MPVKGQFLGSKNSKKLTSPLYARNILIREKANCVRRKGKKFLQSEKTKLELLLGCGKYSL